MIHTPEESKIKNFTLEEHLERDKDRAVRRDSIDNREQRLKGDSKIRSEFLRGHKDRVSHKDMHKAAEELRMEGKGSHDPMYPDSKKNG